MTLLTKETESKLGIVPPCDYTKEDKYTEFANQIAELHANSKNNYLEEGRILSNFISHYDNYDKKIFKTFLKDSRVNLKKTQAYKRIAVFKYCSAHSVQSAELVKKVEVEKIYLITTLQDNERQKELENFIIENNLSVKKIQAVIKELNKNNNLTLEEANENVLKAIDLKNKEQKTAQKSLSESDYEALEEKCKEQSKIISELKSRIELLENKLKQGKENSNQIVTNHSMRSAS